MTEWLHFHFSFSCIGEGSGNPLQCSCLENPRDGGACWAAVYGAAQSQTQLKRLRSSSSIWKKQLFLKSPSLPRDRSSKRNSIVINSLLGSFNNQEILRLTKGELEIPQACPTLCDPMDCSLPVSSVHGIFQAIVPEWIAISFSRGSSQPRDQTHVSRIVDRRFNQGMSEPSSNCWESQNFHKPITYPVT